MTSTEPRTWGRSRGADPTNDVAASPPSSPSSPVERQRVRAAAVPLQTQAEVEDGLEAAAKDLLKLERELASARARYRDEARVGVGADDGMRRRAHEEALAVLKGKERAISGNLRKLNEKATSLVTGLDSAGGHNLTDAELSRAATLRPFIVDELATSSPGEVAAALRGVVLRGDKGESLAWTRALRTWQRNRQPGDSGPAMALVSEAADRLRDLVRDHSLDSLAERARSVQAAATTAQSTIRRAAQSRGEIPDFLTGVIEPTAPDSDAGDGYQGLR